MKVKTERKLLKEQIDKGYIKKTDLFTKVEDMSIPRRSRRSYAIVLGLTPKLDAALEPKGMYWKYRKTVNGYRLKFLKQPVGWVEEEKCPI